MAPFSSMLPSSLYAPTASTAVFSQKFDETAPAVPATVASPTESSLMSRLVPKGVFAPSAKEGGIVQYSSEYWAACAVGGVLSCGLTHMGVTPLDVVKCNMQIDPKKISQHLGRIQHDREDGGLRWTFQGMGAHSAGILRSGSLQIRVLRIFQKKYSDMAGPEFAAKYQTPIFLAGSASAEFIADVALCPFEAVKVKVQTVPGFAKGMSDGFPRFVALEGVGGLFKGITPLWGRQIPYTMMKFACFENTVQALYQYVVPKPKVDCSKPEQLGVSFLAGYIAGVFCAIVSHPADNLVSKMNAQKGATIGDIVGEMGWFALFTRGLPLRIIMIGTLTGLQWGIYDSFKVAVGLPTSGGGPPKDEKK